MRAFADGPARQYEISGIVRFGTVDSIGGATITVFDLDDRQTLFGKPGKLDLIRVSAEDGVPTPSCWSRSSPLLSETTQVRSAAEQASEDSEETQQGLSIVKYFLLGFGGIALFVGSFVIANTLAITVAQRMRELATLRTLGASRRQVLWSVVLESVVVGLVGSVIGLFLGLGVAAGLNAILKATGVELPSEGIVFSTRTIVVSLAVGTLIALLASLRPAIRATRIQPIAAVREGAVMPPSRFARYAVPASARHVPGRARAFSYGVFAGGLEIAVRIFALVLGVLFLFVSVAMVASRVVRPLAFALGAPGARLGGAPGSLARQNAVRNPTTNRLDGGGGDDRARPDHLRRGPRPGRSHVLHRRRERALHRRLRPHRRPGARAGQGGGVASPALPASKAVSEIRGGEAEARRRRRSTSAASTRISRRSSHMTWSSG